MQEHMTTQDVNFEAFALYVTEILVSIRNDMDVNHVAIIDRINYMAAFENDNHHHYMRFTERCVTSWIITMVMMVKDGMRV